MGSGGSGGSIAGSADADAFFARLPQAMCEWYSTCGRIEDGGSVDDCARNLGEEISASVRREGVLCGDVVAYYSQHREALETCLTQPSGACDSDDFGAFCPNAGSVEEVRFCQPTQPTPTDDLSYGDFLERFPAVVCAYYARCGQIEESMVNDCVAGAREDAQQGTNCSDSGLEYFAEFRTQFGRCMQQETAECGRSDDLDLLCPQLEELMRRCRNAGMHMSGGGGSGGEMSGEEEPECTSNSGCGSRRVCRSGRCQRVDCTSDAHCSGCNRCISNRCQSCGRGPFGCYC